MSLQTLSQYRAARIAQAQVLSADASRGATTRPTSAATRPKITWIGKAGGPGETYHVNLEYYYRSSPSGFHSIDGMKLMAYSEKSTNNSNAIADEWGYTTALFQTPDVLPQATMWGRQVATMTTGGYQYHTTLSLKTTESDYTNSGTPRAGTSRT